MKIKKILFLLVFEVSFYMYATSTGCLIGDDIFFQDEEKNIVSLKKMKAPNLDGKWVFQQEIEFGIKAYLIQDIESANYELFLYNYQLKHMDESHILNSPDLPSVIHSVYFTNKSFYTLENNKDNIVLKHFDLEGKLHNSYIISIDSNLKIKKFIFDEINDLIILSFYEYGLSDSIVLYSLKSNKILFEVNGRLLFDISNQKKCIFYSKLDSLFCIDYKTSLTESRMICLSDSKQEIVELKNIGKNFILVTQEKKKNLFLKIIFNTIDWRNKFYLCEFDGEFLVNRKIIQIKNTGEIYN